MNTTNVNPINQGCNPGWIQLLFNDEGMISRKSWWAGTGLLILIHSVLEYFAGKLFAQSGYHASFMLFVSLAILVPFYSVNTKRFRAIGRSPVAAVIGGVLPGLVILSDAFVRIASLDLIFGLLLLAVILWYIIDLGVVDHATSIDLAQRRV